MRRLPVFWIGFAAVAAARALIAASRLDDFRGEELYQGSLAWALLRGLPLDPQHLPVIVHMRGSFVFGVLAAPLYALLGPTYGALKTLAVLWSGLAGGLLAACVERALGRPLALGAACLMAFFPPAYQMVDACAFGSHLDSVVPTLAALLAIVARPGPLGPRRAALLGLALGFGAFFSLQCALAAPAVLAAWWGTDPRFWRRPASLAVLSAALPAAAIPLVSTSSTLVTKPMSAHLLPEGLAGALERVQEAASGDLVRSLLFEVAGGAWLGWLYAAVLLAAWLLLWPRVRRREPLALFALLHPVLVLGAWAASDFELNLLVRLNGMGSRYLMPVLPALAAAVVLGVDLLRARPWAARALLFAPLCAGAVGFASLLDPRPLFDLPRRSGTNFPSFEAHLLHAAEDAAGRIEWSRKVDPDWDAYRPLSFSFLAADPEPAPPGPPSVAAWKRAGALAPELRPYALAALGERAAATPELPRAAQALSSVPPAVGAEDARWFRRGAGASLMEMALARAVQEGAPSAAVYHALSALPEEGREDVLLGAGFKLGRLFTPYNENYRFALEGLSALAPGPRAGFLFGLALGWRLRFREATFAVPAEGKEALERLLAPADRPAFRAGLGAPHTAYAPGS
jgi:hypothetical protein